MVCQRAPAHKGQLEQGEARLPWLPQSEDSNRKLLPLSPFFFLFNQEGSFIFSNKHCLCNLPAWLGLGVGPITEKSNVCF